MNFKNLFTDFFESEKAGGLLLIIVTVISMVIANSPLMTSYSHIWNFEFAHHTVTHWINDGLMAIFFLLVGLELEREIYAGELSELKKAALPVFAAVGGMLIPAGIFLIFNTGLPTGSGAGIPMATDIAFAIGILSLLGNRVPLSLKIFLTALAVIDDLGAIIIIALFYTESLQINYLLGALIMFALLFGLKRMNINNLIPYLIGGIIMWYCMLNSGIHATIAGVLLAFVIPDTKGDDKSPSTKLQHFLHKPVAFLILPLFAAANTLILLDSKVLSSFGDPVSIGIIAGLVIGKPLGIFLFSMLAVSMGIASLPQNVKWSQIISVGVLGGIGFTMSIFITLLAFTDPATIVISKVAIVIAAILAGIIGYVALSRTLKSIPENL